MFASKVRDENGTPTGIYECGRCLRRYQTLREADPCCESWAPAELKEQSMSALSVGDFVCTARSGRYPIGVVIDIDYRRSLAAVQWPLGTKTWMTFEVLKRLDDVTDAEKEALRSPTEVTIPGASETFDRVARNPEREDPRTRERRYLADLVINGKMPVEDVPTEEVPVARATLGMSTIVTGDYVTLVENIRYPLGRVVRTDNDAYVQWPLQPSLAAVNLDRLKRIENVTAEEREACKRVAETAKTDVLEMIRKRVREEDPVAVERVQARLRAEQRERDATADRIVRMADGRFPMSMRQIAQVMGIDYDAVVKTLSEEPPGEYRVMTNVDGRYVLTNEDNQVIARETSAPEAAPPAREVNGRFATKSKPEPVKPDTRSVEVKRFAELDFDFDDEK